MTVLGRDLVVVGASAGGVEALRDLVRELPGDLAAAVLVVLHLPSTAPSALPAILRRAGHLDAKAAEDGDRLEAGRVLVAPPDHHLVVRDGCVSVARGPRENGHRPAIDPLFRSAAVFRGSRTVGVVLSGSLDDGAAGLRSIVDRGGAAVVQDPEAALYDGMPRAALAAVPEATVASGADLGRAVARLCREPADDDPAPPPGDLLMETGISQMDEASLADPDRPGRPAAMTCPDCGGAMFEIDEDPLVRFRCRVGHAWSPESLLRQQADATEAALWAAIRTLEEKAALHRKLAEKVSSEAMRRSRRFHDARAHQAAHSAEVLRDLLRRHAPDDPADYLRGSQGAG